MSTINLSEHPPENIDPAILKTLRLRDQWETTTGQSMTQADAVLLAAVLKQEDMQAIRNHLCGIANRIEDVYSAMSCR